MRLEERLLNSKVRRCQHVKASGNQCNVAAMRDHNFCHFHTQVERQQANKFTVWTDMPHIEDTAALKLALNQVLGHLFRGTIDRRDAALMLNYLRTMLAVLRLEATKAPLDPDVVTDYDHLEENVNWNKHLSDAQAKEREEQDDPANSEGCRSIAEVLLPITERLFGINQTHNLNNPHPTDASPTSPDAADSDDSFNDSAGDPSAFACDPPPHSIDIAPASPPASA